jgi:dUTPase
VAPVLHATLRETSALADTSRGDGGFGSTGTRPEEQRRG